MTTKIIKGEAAILKAIGTFTTNADKLNANAHSVAMSIMHHAKDHGRNEMALALCLAMPASMRRTMMRDWFAKYSPIAVKLASKKEPAKVGWNKGKNAAAWDLDGADAEPFYMLAEKVPEETEYNFAQLIAMVQGVTKRISKKIEEGKVPANDIDKAKAFVLKVNSIAA